MEIGRRESRRCVRSVLLFHSLAFVAYVPVAGAAWPVILLLGVGTVVVIIVLVLFLTDERYRRPPKPERDVGFIEARMVAGNRLSSLAPKVVLLAEKEGIVDDFLAGWVSDDETRRTVEGLRREVSATGFWRRFVVASALIEEDPARASGELRLLSLVAEAALEKLNEAERIIEGIGGGNGGRA
ncbi:MAG: hypothetical protein LC781_02155 [Actinobacteria bacterium]|nr:hypothetical protein [Actinomycetota bacterium]